MINGFQRSSWGHCSIMFLVFGDPIVHSHGVKPDKTDYGDLLASMISILLYLANLILSTLLSLCSSHLVSILSHPQPSSLCSNLMYHVNDTFLDYPIQNCSQSTSLTHTNDPSYPVLHILLYSTIYHVINQ